MEPERVAEAFKAVEAAPDHISAVVRPVLLRAIQDPATIRALGEHALLDHLALAWQTVSQMRDAAEGPLLSLPQDLRMFEAWLVARPFEDAEEAFNYVNSLSGEERVRLGTALALTVHTEGLRSSYSLLALARLLQFALEDTTFLQHVLGGGPIEDFLPPVANEDQAVTRHHRSVQAAASTEQVYIGGTGVGAGGQSPRTGLPVREPDAEFTAQFAHTGTSASRYFEGKHVRILVRAEPALPLMVVDGVCVEISENHVMVVTRPSRPDVVRGDALLFGMNSVFRISLTPDSRDSG